MGSKLAGTPVRVGFGKADVNLAMALTNEAGPNAQGPTRALCKYMSFLGAGERSFLAGVIVGFHFFFVTNTD